MAVVVWQDSKMVYVMSTNDFPNANTTVKQWTNEGNRIDVSCPMGVKKYNQYMRGVDRGDQFRGYYHVRMKSKKVYKYGFWFAFELVILNAFTLLKHF